MNYTQKASVSGALTYPYQQITLDLSTGYDFTKLNSSPITILTATTSYILCPAQIVVQYKNSGLLPNDTIYFGYETLLNANAGTAYIGLNLTTMAGQRGAFTFTTRFYNNDFCDTSNTQPLILWMNADVNVNFDNFFLTITYIEIPNLI